jgi:hypothetical protein
MRIRPRLSYANVASTLALVLALGGTSYAVTQINGKTIKNRSVPAVKVKKNTLTGTEIKESKVGKVPLAALATNATTALNATNATHANNADSLGGQPPSAYKLSCPSDTTLAIGECFEFTLRTAATWSDASKTCGGLGRRVPTIGELESARQNNVSVGVPPNNYELSSSLVFDNPTDRAYAISPAGNLLRETLSNTRPYRCILSPTN